MGRVSSLKFPGHAKKLHALLEQDQKEWREFASEEFEVIDKSSLDGKKQQLRHRVRERAQSMLKMLDEIGEPSISNIGTSGAVAISVLATHDSLATTKHVLGLFNKLYERKASDTHREPIPAMTDWVLVLERKPQKFGTIWLIDKAGWPFLPPVEDFEYVNERRERYGIGPLRWPKLLAIPENKQPWLTRPLDTLSMRAPSKDEYRALAQDYV